VRLVARLRRLVVWLEDRFGSNQIAIELEGEEAIPEEEWRKLPADERARWEPADSPMPLYRRKPW
jgi:hypothetical protein